MNYQLFLTALFSLASAAYTVTDETVYIVSYRAQLKALPGKTCTGFGKVETIINGKTYYGKELYPTDYIQETVTPFEIKWKSPKGVTEVTVERRFKYSPDGSNNFEYSSTNCKVIYTEQKVKPDGSAIDKLPGEGLGTYSGECPAYNANPDVLPYLEKRIKVCVAACGITVPIAGLIATAYFPPAIVAIGPAAAGCAGTCKRRVCEKGLFLGECRKLGSSCEPDGLRCCKRPNGSERKCEKNFRGKYKCEN